MKTERPAMSCSPAAPPSSSSRARSAARASSAANPNAPSTPAAVTMSRRPPAPSPGPASSVHTATGNQPFGIEVYGYGYFTSYMYPGGLDLGVKYFQPPPAK